MRSILQINTSLFGDGGQSSQLATRFASGLAARTGAELIVRDFARDPVPHLDAQRFGAFVAKPQERTSEQNAAVAYSDMLIDELRRADTIVLGLPFYNFGVPSTLKAYFDHVARAGVTFRYTATGAEGLLKGKRVYVFATRGGNYVGTPLDTQTSYVRDFLAFVGLSDIQFVYAEGLGISEASRQIALDHARTAADALVHAATRTEREAA